MDDDLCTGSDFTQSWFWFTTFSWCDTKLTFVDLFSCAFFYAITCQCAFSVVKTIFHHVLRTSRRVHELNQIRYVIELASEIIETRCRMIADDFIDIFGGFISSRVHPEGRCNWIRILQICLLRIVALWGTAAHSERILSLDVTSMKSTSSWRWSRYMMTDGWESHEKIHWFA